MPPVFKRVSDGGVRYRPAGVDSPFYTEVTVTTTGNIDDLNFSNVDVIRMNNATDATIRGLVAGVAGQRVRIISVGAGNVLLAHQNAGSAAANRLINTATSANTPLAAGSGVATYVYDATTARWRLIEHRQGALILNPYSAGDWSGFGGMTWTVDAGDINTDGYFLEGNLLTIVQYLATSSVSGGNPFLAKKIPGSFTCSKAMGAGLSEYQDNGGSQLIGGAFTNGAATTTIFYQKADGTNWAAAVNTTVVIASPRVLVD